MADTNKVSKNVEKGLWGAVIAGVAIGAAEGAVAAGLPAEVKPAIIAGVTGFVYAVVNWFKHRK